jgi:hypothetical protein
MSKAWNWNEVKGTVATVESVFSPLDEELQLLPGQYTPQMQGTMTRLGSKMPFKQAVEEVWLNEHTYVEESTLRRIAYVHGEAAEALERAEVERLEREAPTSKASPQQLFVSADGALIQLTTGEWCEVKTMAVGEFASIWNAKKGEVQVKGKEISYYSRSYRAREFERYALAELQRRGIFNAQRVVTINDGAQWIQSFADYHFDKAVRILDFSHAMEYVSSVGQSVWGEGTEQFKQWYKRTRHQLKHEPPQKTLSELGLLSRKAKTDDALATIDNALRYLSKRLDQIDYPHFQKQGFPIGSGSVECSHKIVVQSRMKRGGMRWAEAHVDPMLALRNLVVNGRWVEGWSQIVAFHWHRRCQEMKEWARGQHPSAPPITFDSVKVAPSSAAEECPPASKPKQNIHPYRPAPDHPWRRGIWPSYESWRWN